MRVGHHYRIIVKCIYILFTAAASRHRLPGRTMGGRPYIHLHLEPDELWVALSVILSE